MREPYSEVDGRESEEEEGTLARCMNLTRGRDMRNKRRETHARTLRKEETDKRATRCAEDKGHEEDDGAATDEAARYIIRTRVYYVRGDGTVQYAI